MTDQVRYQEPMDIAAAINQLMLEFGSEVWLVGNRLHHDSAGTRLVIEVDDQLYVDDFLPRMVKTEFGPVFCIVQRVPSKVVMEDVLMTETGLA